MKALLGMLQKICEILYLNNISQKWAFGVVGDAVNVLLSAAAYNFKRAMKALLGMLQKICEILYLNNISQKWAF